MRPTAAIAAVAILWAIVMPFINEQVSFDAEIEPGTVLDVGGDVTFTPPVGWELDADSSPGAVIIHHSGLTATLRIGSFDGELDQLLAAANKALDMDAIVGPQVSIETTEGLVGIGEQFDGANQHGEVAVFANDGVGLQVIIVGPAPTATNFGGEINEMLTSISFGGKEPTS